VATRYRMVFKGGKWTKVPITTPTRKSSTTSTITSRSASDIDKFQSSSPYASATKFGGPQLERARSFETDDDTGPIQTARGPYALRTAKPITDPATEGIGSQFQTDEGAGGDPGLTGTDLFGYDPMKGGSKAITGDLQAQLGAFAELEGTFRQDYKFWREGTPQTPKEAFMFLQQAQASDLNTITFTQLDDYHPMVQKARNVKDDASQTDEMRLWASEIVRINDWMGGKLYTRQGTVLTDPEEIEKYEQMVRYKARAQGLIDEHRTGRQNLLEGSIKHGYAMGLESERTASAAAVAEIQERSSKAVAEINAQVDRDIAAIQKKTAEEQMQTQRDISAAEVVGRKEVADIQAAGGLAIEKERSRGAEDVEIQRGIQDVNRIREQGKNQIAAIENQRDADMQLLQEEMTSRERISMREQDTQLLKIERESTAQQTLVQLSADLDMELETSKQNWQSAETDKELAIAEGNLQEAIRSNFMQEQIQIEQQQIERETNSLNMLMNISQNPALLYFMKESGMLSGVGPSLLGEDTESLINDLTASIDPGNLPNIQTYNAMSELQQQIANFRTGATTGMTPEAQQEYLQGASPFTRGQRSTIRVGSRANPFETMSA
jgi:hypothetical protein